MRILVAMSGGVDSSTVAGLLHEAGHEVIGVTLQLYDHGAATGRKGACCAGQDIHDARRVADHLGIPHYVIDAEKRFADAVIGDFADSYAAGETPVPCVRCNQTVKFADLTALARGPWLRAAGDRALCAADRRAGRRGTASRRRPGARPELVPVRHHARAACADAVSAGRDGRQAGGARRGGAARAAGGGEAGQPGHLLRRRPATMPTRWCGCGRMPASRATSSAADGRVLGRHDGIARYTVGQGKRLGAAAARCAASGRSVVALDPARRRVVVGPRDAGTRDGPAARGELAGPPPDAPLACQVKLRAREVPQAATRARRAGWRRGAAGRARAAGARAGLRVLRWRPRAGRRLHLPAATRDG